jgi:hypothetical protein
MRRRHSLDRHCAVEGVEVDGLGHVRREHERVQFGGAPVRYGPHALGHPGRGEHASRAGTLSRTAATTSTA